MSSILRRNFSRKINWTWTWTVASGAQNKHKTNKEDTTQHQATCVLYFTSKLDQKLVHEQKVGDGKTSMKKHFTCCSALVNVYRLAKFGQKCCFWLFGMSNISLVINQRLHVIVWQCSKTTSSWQNRNKCVNGLECALLEANSCFDSDTPVFHWASPAVSFLWNSGSLPVQDLKILLNGVKCCQKFPSTVIDLWHESWRWHRSVAISEVLRSTRKWLWAFANKGNDVCFLQAECGYIRDSGFNIWSLNIWKKPSVRILYLSKINR